MAKFSVIAVVVGLMLLLGVVPLDARPVSYPGGWTVMQMNDDNKHLLHVHYSPTAKYSVGYEVAYWKGKEFQTHSLKVNNLLKRWNMSDAQANIYLKSGIGIAYDSSGDFSDNVEPHYFTGLSTDWENRRFFTQYENSFHYSGEIDDEFMQSVRFGIAPYIGEYGDLHAWLMVRVEHEPDEDEPVTITPHVRFFKGVYMLELGYSPDSEEVLANLIIRF